MNLFAFLVVGLVSGFLAGKIVEGHGFGFVGDTAVGIAGALIGGYFVTNSIFYNGYFPSAIVTSTFGAVVFLLVAGLFHTSRRLQKARGQI